MSPEKENIMSTDQQKDYIVHENYVAIGPKHHIRITEMTEGENRVAQRYVQVARLFYDGYHEISYHEAVARLNKIYRLIEEENKIVDESA